MTRAQKEPPTPSGEGVRGSGPFDGAGRVHAGWQEALLPGVRPKGRRACATPPPAIPSLPPHFPIYQKIDSKWMRRCEGVVPCQPLSHSRCCACRQGKKHCAPKQSCCDARKNEEGGQELWTCFAPRPLKAPTHAAPHTCFKLKHTQPCVVLLGHCVRSCVCVGVCTQLTVESTSGQGLAAPCPPPTRHCTWQAFQDAVEKKGCQCSLSCFMNGAGWDLPACTLHPAHAGSAGPVGRSITFFGPRANRVRPR